MHFVNLGTGNQPHSKAYISDSDHKQVASNANKQPQSDNPYNLKVESAVQFGDPLTYGVIKWIGSLPKYGDALQAGLKMVNY